MSKKRLLVRLGAAFIGMGYTQQGTLFYSLFMSNNQSG
jgi:hypothetical protein